MASINLPDYVNERNADRIMYAYDGDSLSYALRCPDGQVLCVDFLPENYPALNISTYPSAQVWYDGLSEFFFGLFDENVLKELRENADRLGVTLSAETRALLYPEDEE